MGIKMKPIKNTAFVKMPSTASGYAQKLYAILRELDLWNLNTIYIELPPNKPEWLAVRDRLMRAAG
jgi:L-threonylcarbamoyladenylate synthase